MTNLNGLQSKRKTKEDQNEEFGERKTPTVRCHAFSPNGNSNYACGLGGRNKLRKDPWMVFLCFKAKMKMYKYQGFAWQR